MILFASNKFIKAIIHKIWQKGEMLAKMLVWSVSHHDNTVWCCYNVANFLKKKINERHPIAHPFWQGMGYLLWIQHLTDILPQFLQLSMKFLTMLDHVRHSTVCWCFFLNLFSADIWRYFSIRVISSAFTCPHMLCVPWGSEVRYINPSHAKFFRGNINM